MHRAYPSAESVPFDKFDNLLMRKDITRSALVWCSIVVRLV